MSASNPGRPAKVSSKEAPATTSDIEHKSLRRFLPLVAPLAIGIGLWVLHSELEHFRFADLVQYLQGFPRWKLLLALTLTTASYLTLTLYDVLAFLHLQRALSYRRIALASFIGYAFSNNLNALVSGLPIRFRLYTAWGVPAAEVLKVFAFTILGFWLGFLSLSGITFTLFPRAIPAGHRLLFVTDRPLGILCLIVMGVYLLANLMHRPNLRLWRWQLPLPGPGWTLAQIAVASLDWSLAAAVLFIALPAGSELSYPGFLGLFLLAQFLGLLSQSPGGLGVFDTAIVVLLAPAVPAAQALGALLVYRTVYYLLPLSLAGLSLVAFELYERREHVGQVADAIGRWAPSVVPWVMSVLVFLAGTVLLVSGAVPAVGSRLGWLSQLLPLPLIEISHLVGSLAGILLLILAHGLQRRIDAAYHLTIGLLVVGILASLMKGVDWEEAGLLALMLAALVPCRAEFHRRSSLLNEPLTWTWAAAILSVVLAVVWLGFFTHRHIEYSGELWWRFELSADAPRTLRATVGVIAALFLFGATRLLRPAAPDPAVPTAEDLETAEDVVRASPRSYAYLALLGDKRLLFNEDRSALLMFAIEGRSWIAMGDPVGPESEGTELSWRFQSLCERHDGWPVFYQVGSRTLGRYVEMGLSLMKLGEEARVPLAGFSLEGPARAELRQAFHRGQREGLELEILSREAVSPVVSDLKGVSDAWMEEKKGIEKGFSLGFFDREYLLRCPLAAVRREERIVAFANLWPAGQKEELSVDLMRYDPAAAPRGVMDYLLTSLMVWGADQGFHWFNLGMAPLAGLDGRPEGPLWNRLGAFVYRHGEEYYNFGGLRRFKQKFDPVWEPRFLASPAGLALPRVLTDLIRLISGERSAI